MFAALSEGTIFPRGYLRVLLQKEKKKERELSDEGYVAMNIQQIKSSLTQAQIQCFDAIYDWRDRTAREEDESPGFLLSNDELVAIGQAVPTSQKALLALYEKPLGDPKLGQRSLRKNAAATSRVSVLVDVIKGSEWSEWTERRQSSFSSSSFKSQTGDANNVKKSKLLANSMRSHGGTRRSLFTSQPLRELHPLACDPQAAPSSSSIPPLLLMSPTSGLSPVLAESVIG